jgi:nicotinamide mononucleotide transporter
MAFLELIAALLGIVSVGLVVARSIWAFPIGILMVSMYGWIFFQVRLYSDMLLQIAFIALQIQGWLRWAKGPKSLRDNRIEVRQLSSRHWLFTISAIGLGTLVLGTLMNKYTNAAIPYLDAGTTATSLTAQWWMNNRYIENWLLWIAVDAVYVYQYSSQQLYYTTGLYAVFFGMAIWGYRNWRVNLT